MRNVPGNTPPAASLSDTQMRVLDGIRRGLMNKQIARELGLSVHTVKYHLSGIFRKTGCHRRRQLRGLGAMLSGNP